MHRNLWGIIALAVVLPSAAGAQQAPPMMPRAGAGSAFESGIAPGITVTGSGTASAPADDANITLQISSRTAAITAANLQPIVDALVSAGMDRTSVIIPLYLQAPNAVAQYVSLSGTVHHPSLGQLRAAVPIIGAQFARQPSLNINNAQIRLHVANCGHLRRQAETAAISAARSEADYVARQLGVRPGAVAGVTINGAADPSGGCDTVTFLPFQGGQSQDPTRDVNVHVSAYAVVRYDIAR